MAGALGAASCAFVGSGDLDSFHQVKQFIKVKGAFYTGSRRGRDVCQALFRSYKDVYRGLKKAYIGANLDRFKQKHIKYVQMENSKELNRIREQIIKGGLQIVEGGSGGPNLGKYQHPGGRHPYADHPQRSDL